MKQIWGVSNAEIDKVWFGVARLLERIKDRDKTLIEIYQGLRDRKYQLWTGWEDTNLSLVLVTETYTLKGRQVCSLFLCAGNDMDRWLDHFPTVEKWAESKGYEVCQLVGRKGWARVLKTMGYSVTGRDGDKYIISKELKNEF